MAREAQNKKDFDKEFKTVDEVRCFISERIDICLCSAESFGFETAAKCFLEEMSELAEVVLEDLLMKNDF